MSEPPQTREYADEGARRRAVTSGPDPRRRVAETPDPAGDGS